MATRDASLLALELPSPAPSSLFLQPPQPVPMNTDGEKTKPAISKLGPSAGALSAFSCVRLLTSMPTALARAAAFMPQLKAANEKLQQDMKVQPREQFDIEVVNEDEPHIVMV
jgi:hypothetical protein